MPQQIELGAKVSTKLAVLANARPKSHTHTGANEIECPNCGFAFSTTKSKHLPARLPAIPYLDQRLAPQAS
ncbi:MAG TPA: hypothetical protein VE977_00950 [Pyrinomonadaceae bacterium]|nr:hypothetical protein [Pyrinomonadaceae bacterium]